jgi:hypothetical protein
MSASRKLIFYLLLNVFLSACVTLAVLFIYETYYRPSTLPQPALAAKDSASFEIAAIVGAGLPDSEMVLIRNTGSAVSDLKNWQLRDEDGNTYVFDALLLPANAAIQLRTAPGTNSVIDLYWGLAASAWVSGETATLLDPDGNMRSIYQVP